MKVTSVFETLLVAEKRAKMTDFVLKGLANGTLKPVINKIFPLENIVEAHRYLESNQHVGKVVVTLALSIMDEKGTKDIALSRMPITKRKQTPFARCLMKQ